MMTMEYRVLYYTESYSDGLGSPVDPWIVYVGDNQTLAREAFEGVREHLSAEWTVRLQKREVNGWVTVQGMRSGMAQLGSALGS